MQSVVDLPSLSTGASVHLLADAPVTFSLAGESRMSRVQPDPRWELDADTAMFLRRWDEPPGGKVLEVGANEERAGECLADYGWHVVGHDLRSHQSLPEDKPRPGSWSHVVGDFVELAKMLPDGCFDAAFSLSAVEHFGLNVYGYGKHVEDLDVQTMQQIHRVLRPGGTCHLTVPFCHCYREERDWRVYDERSVRERLVGDFAVEDEVYFKSGGCCCPDVDGIVTKADAVRYDGGLPHITIYMKLRKQIT